MIHYFFSIFICLSKFRYISKNTFNRLNCTKIESNDILVGRMPDPKGRVGRAFRWPKDMPSSITSVDVCILKVDKNIILPEYLEFFLNHPLTLALSSSLLGGTSHPRLKKRDIESLVVIYPDIKKQSEVVRHVRPFLDLQYSVLPYVEEFSKELISALFRSWFIDFDPVKAKSEGKLAYGMDKETAALFPNMFEDSELGPIPSGWNINRYSDCMDLRYGGALKAEERIEGEFPVMGSNGIVGKHNEYLVNGPGIVVGRKGNPGTVNWIDENFFPIDTTFYVQSQDKNVPLEFLYHSLYFASLPWFSADSAVPGINRNVVLQQKFIHPPIKLIEVFRKTSEAIIQKRSNISHIIDSIELLRDAMLPRLMSGELKLN